MIIKKSILFIYLIQNILKNYKFLKILVYHNNFSVILDTFDCDLSLLLSSSTMKL